MPLMNQKCFIQVLFKSVILSVYTCERTRRQTLRESFQSRVTIFASVLLGISSVSVLAGYSVWRQLVYQKKMSATATGGESFIGTF